MATTGPAGAASTLHLRYALYVHGFRALQANATLTLDGAHYEVTVEDHAAGLVGALIDNHTESRAEGVLDAAGAQPGHYSSTGFSRGTDRQTVIDYVADRPVVRVLEPVETRRDPVPPAQTMGAVDPLSAFAAAVARVVSTGNCDARFAVFDGARLSDVEIHSAGTVTLPASGRSSYGGTALRCDFSTRQVAGFLHNDNYARAHDPQDGTAWVGRVAPDASPVPVRAEFSTLDHGVVQAYLVREESK